MWSKNLSVNNPQLHSDMDKGDGSIKYILTGEGAGTTFTIDDSTGDIHAIQRLDREVKAQYALRAQARNRLTDRPLEPESEFIVKIQDINDNEPKFLDGPYQASVPEMSKIGELEEDEGRQKLNCRLCMSEVFYFLRKWQRTKNNTHKSPAESWFWFVLTGSSPSASFSIHKPTFVVTLK